MIKREFLYEIHVFSIFIHSPLTLSPQQWKRSLKIRRKILLAFVIKKPYVMYR